MDFRKLLVTKKIKQVEIAKALKLYPSSISLFINGIRPFPKKYHQKLSEILGVSMVEISKSGKSQGGNKYE